MRPETFDAAQHEAGDFGAYQLRVFLATQLGYLCITGSILCTMYDTILPSADLVNCSNATFNQSFEMDFHSLLLELGLTCAHSYIPTLFSTAVMAGGVLGAVFCGFWADRIGRKFVVMGTLAGCVLLNALIALLGAVWWPVSVLMMLCLGFCGGGYMVSNLVLLLEVTGNQFWRLGATAFNGWPYGLMFMSLLGYLTGFWRHYHVALCAIGLVALLPMFFVLDESARWLVQHGRVDEAQRILAKTARINNRQLSDATLNLAAHFTDEKTSAHQQEANEILAQRRYTYADLLRHRQITIYLAALFYSWLASSIISFGIYFSLGRLAGDRFFNTFLTGLFKAVTGALPFVVCRWVGRKPILMVAVGAACLACWAAVAVVLRGGGVALTIFALVGASAIDPIWKVNHLYSTELFPTVVRNMARAVCNVGSRAGSLIAPQVAHLHVIHVGLPYGVFGVLSLFHVLVCAVYLPETKGRPLPDRLPDEAHSADTAADEAHSVV